MTEVLSVVGARPQFIKAAPVSRALAKSGLSEFLVHTGQHYDPQMSEVFFSELGLRAPDLNLGVGSGLQGAQAAAMLTGMERAILDQKPNWVLVYGDTNSTLAGALAAAKLNVPVAHVEAGLRSFNRGMPEEINRVVTDAVSSLLFVPSETAHQNLRREGVPEERIHWTGDVMYDAMLLFGETLPQRPGILERLQVNGAPFVLATIHRAETTDDLARLQSVMQGLRVIAKQMRVIVPLHPRTRARLQQMPTFDTRPVDIIEPVGFLDMIRLEKAAAVIATDSGGVQKEAFFHQVPCVTLREETEWKELITLGWNRLASPLDYGQIASTILSALGTKGRAAAPYGSGNASERIAATLAAEATGRATPRNDILLRQSLVS